MFSFEVIAKCDAALLICLASFTLTQKRFYRTRVEISQTRQIYGLTQKRKVTPVAIGVVIFSENPCQKNNNFRTQKNLGKQTIVPKSTLNFAYMHIKNIFLKCEI